MKFPITPPRAVFASSSRLPILHTSPSQMKGPLLQVRKLSLLTQRNPEPFPFFTPPFRSRPPAANIQNEKGKGKAPGPPNLEDEVDDREWEMRVAQGMLHLRETLPFLFHPERYSGELFPPEVYSQNVVLKLPAPIPIKTSSLAAYSMAFSLARSGMQALHTDLSTSLERMTFTPTPSCPSPLPSPPQTNLKITPPHRSKQIRLLVSVHGKPRLPPHSPATWQTSSLYTFSPYSGLISSHEIETIRPLPGEGVGEWLMTRLLGWTSRHANSGEGVVHPGAAMVREEVVRMQGQTLEKEKRG